MSQTNWENLASWLSLAVAALVAIVYVTLTTFNGRFVAWIGGPCSRAEQMFSKLASGTAMCFVLIPTLSFAINLSIALQRGIPRPLIHDEFSYLLAADTFAHGRLTNPTPPMWEQFETPQELMRPTYMSKYPPGQGIALAIGQLTTGIPIVGVWISTAAACVAIYWMLRTFVAPPWALFGGMVAAIHPVMTDWSRVYWGGSVAVIGGALLLGAWGRLMRRPSKGVAIILAVSLVVLGNSRPYEGLVLCSALLLTGLVNGERPWNDLVKKVVVPAGVVILIALIGMGWYNSAITGNAFRLPFAEYSGQYDVYPKFWFLPKRVVPAYRNESLKWVHLVFEKGDYESLRTLAGLARASWVRPWELVHWQAKPVVLFLPLLIGLLVARDERLPAVRITVGIFVVGLWLENFFLPHYAAPVFPLMLLLTIVGWHQMSKWKWRSFAVGRLLVAAIAVGFVAGAGMIIGQPISRDSIIVGHAGLAEMSSFRTGRHLVFVRYEAGRSFNNEYVFNDADIAESKVIWVRSSGASLDRQLAAHFPGREIWRLTVGDSLHLDPYVP